MANGTTQCYVIMGMIYYHIHEFWEVGGHLWKTIALSALHYIKNLEGCI